MSRPEIRAVVVGLGAVGSTVSKILLEKKGVKIVGAVDKSRQKTGKDLGEVLRLGKGLGVTVSDEADKVFATANADIAVCVTTSRLKEVYEPVMAALRHRVNVITACEEMAQANVVEPRMAQEIDKLARQNNVTVVGSGRNPGLCSEVLALMLTSMCTDVKRIKRTGVSFSYTTVPGQEDWEGNLKFGIGVGREQFDSLAKQGKIYGHVGGAQSITNVAAGLGWKLERLEHVMEPVIEGKKTVGTRVIDKGYMDGKEVLTWIINFQLPTKELKKPTVLIEIEGNPSFSVSIDPYQSGPLKTASILVNQIPHVINAPPGLLTPTQLPLSWAVLGDMRDFLKERKQS